MKFTPSQILRRLVTLMLIPSLMLDPHWAGAIFQSPSAGAEPIVGRFKSEALSDRSAHFNWPKQTFSFHVRQGLLRREGAALRAWLAVVGWGFRHPALSFVASAAVPFAINSLLSGAHASWSSPTGPGGLLLAMNFLTNIPHNLFAKGSGKAPVVLCSLYDDPGSPAARRLDAKLETLSQAAVPAGDPDFAAGEIDAMRQEIRSVLAREMGGLIEAVPDLFVLNPPGGKDFFQDGHVYGAVHFTPERIYFSLPILRALKNHKDRAAILGDMAVHIAAHLQGETHDDASGYESSPEKLNRFLRERWEEQMEFEDLPQEVSATADSSSRPHELLSSVVRIPQLPRPYPNYKPLMKPAGTGLSDKEWFEQQIGGGEGWRRELVLYPFEKGKCAFRDTPNWIFLYVNDAAKCVLPLGPEEIGSFGILTRDQVKAEKNAFYRTPIAAENDQELHLRNSLNLLQQPRVLAALLEQPEFGEDHPDDRLALLGFVRIAMTKDYYHRVRVLKQQVAYVDRPEHPVQLTAERLDQALSVVRRLVDEGLQLDGHLTIPTDLQILAGRHAVAQQMGRRDNFEKYGVLAPQTARRNRELGFFTRRWVALTRSLGVAADPRQRRRGKPIDHLRVFVFAGSGTAHGADALHAAESVVADIGGEGKGVQVDQIEIHDVDASRAVLDEAKSMMQGRTWKNGQPVNYHTHLANVKRGLPFQTGSVDFFETPLLNDLEAGFGDAEATAAVMAAYLREVNRVMAEDGYLLLTTGSNPALRWALDRLGFDALTEPDAEIRFAAGILGELAPEDAAKRDRLRSRLYGTGYVLAVKRQTVHPWEQRRMTETGDLVFDENGAMLEDPAVLEALASWRTEHDAAKADEGRHMTRRPEHVDIGNIGYGRSSADAALPSGITRAEITERYPDFAAHLECLRVAAEDEALGPKGILRLQRLRALYESSLSGPLEFLTRAVMAWRDLYADFGFATVLPRKDVEWVERRIKGRRWQPSEKGPEEGDAEDESPKNPAPKPAVDVPVADSERIPDDSLWAVYGPQAKAAVPVEFVASDKRSQEKRSVEAEPAPIKHALPDRTLAPETRGWKELTDQFPEVKDIAGVLFARGVFAWRGRDPLVVRDVIAAQLQTLPISAPQEIFEGLLAFLGITPEILTAAEQARADELFQEAVAAIRVEIERTSADRRVADRFTESLARRITSLYNDAYDEGKARRQIENMLSEKPTQISPAIITVAKVIEILRSKRQIQDPEPVTDPQVSAKALADLLDHVWANRRLDAKEWRDLQYLWGRREGRPLNSPQIDKAAQDLLSTTSLPKSEGLVDAMYRFVIELNRHYLLGRNCLVLINKVVDPTLGTVTEAAVMEIDSAAGSRVDYRLEGHSLPISTVRVTRLLHAPVRPLAALLTVPGWFVAVFMPDIREEAGYLDRLRAAVGDSQLAVEARDWMSRHFAGMSEEAIREELANDARARFVAEHAAHTIQGGSPSQAPMLRQESPLDALVRTMAQPAGLVPAATVGAQAVTGVFGYLQALRAAAHPARTMFRLLAPGFDTLTGDNRTVHETSTMVLSLLAQKVAPELLVKNQFPFESPAYVSLARALSGLELEEWNLLTDELIEENFTRRLEGLPGTKLRMVPIRDSELGRLGPFTAHRLARLYDKALEDGFLDAKRWAAVSTSLAARLGAELPEAVSSAAARASQPLSQDHSLKQGRFEVVRWLNALNAEYLGSRQVLIIPSQDSEPDWRSAVVQTRFTLTPLDGIEGVIRLHQVERILAPGFPIMSGVVSVRDIVSDPDRVKESRHRWFTLIARRAEAVKIMRDNGVTKPEAIDEEQTQWSRIVDGANPILEETVQRFIKSHESYFRMEEIANLLDQEAFRKANEDQQQNWAARRFSDRDLSLVVPFYRSAVRPDFSPEAEPPAGVPIALAHEFWGYFGLLNAVANEANPHSLIMAALPPNLFMLATARRAPEIVAASVAPLIRLARALLDPSFALDVPDFRDPQRFVDHLLTLSKLLRQKRPAELRAAARLSRRTFFNVWVDVDGNTLRLVRDDSPASVRADLLEAARSGVQAALDTVDLTLFSCVSDWLIAECLSLPGDADKRALWQLFALSSGISLPADAEAAVLEALGVRKDKDDIERAIEDLQDWNRNKETNKNIKREWVEGFVSIANSKGPRQDEGLRDLQRAAGTSSSVEQILAVLSGHQLILTPEIRAAREKAAGTELATWFQSCFDAQRPDLAAWPAHYARLKRLFPDFKALDSYNEQITTYFARGELDGTYYSRWVYRLILQFNEFLGTKGHVLLAYPTEKIPGALVVVYYAQGHRTKTQSYEIVGMRTIREYELLSGPGVKATQSYSTYGIGYDALKIGKSAAGLEQMLSEPAAYRDQYSSLDRALPWLLKISGGMQAKGMVRSMIENDLWRNLSWHAADAAAEREIKDLSPDESKSYDAESDPKEFPPYIVFAERLLRPGSGIQTSFQRLPRQVEPGLRAIAAKAALQAYSELEAMATAPRPVAVLGNFFQILFITKGDLNELTFSQAIVIKLLAEKLAIAGCPDWAELWKGARIPVNVIHQVSEALLKWDDEDLRGLAEDILHGNFLIRIRPGAGNKISVDRFPADSPIPLRPALEDRLKTYFLALRGKGTRVQGTLENLCRSLDRALGPEPVPADLRTPVMPGDASQGRLVEFPAFLRAWNDRYFGPRGHALLMNTDIDNKPCLLPLRQGRQKPTHVRGGRDFLRYETSVDGSLLRTPTYGSESVGLIINPTRAARIGEGLWANIQLWIKKEEADKDKVLATTRLLAQSVARWLGIHWSETAYPGDPKGPELGRLMLEADERFAALSLITNQFGEQGMDKFLTEQARLRSLGSMEALGPLLGKDRPGRSHHRAEALKGVFAGLNTLATTDVPHRFLANIILVYVSTWDGSGQGQMTDSQALLFDLLSTYVDGVRPVSARLLIENPPDFLNRLVDLSIALRRMEPAELKALAERILRDNFTVRVIAHADDDFEVEHRPRDGGEGEIDSGSGNPVAGTSPDARSHSIPAVPPMSGEKLMQVSAGLRALFLEQASLLRNTTATPERITPAFLLELVRHPDLASVRGRFSEAGIPERYEFAEATLELVQKVVDIRETAKAGLNEHSLQFLLSGFFESMLRSGVLDYGKFEDLAGTLEMLIPLPVLRPLEKAARVAASAAPQSEQSRSAIAAFIKEFNESFLQDLRYTLSVQGDKIAVKPFSAADTEDFKLMVVRAFNDESLEETVAAWLQRHGGPEGLKISVELVKKCLDSNRSETKKALRQAAIVATSYFEEKLDLIRQFPAYTVRLADEVARKQAESIPKDLSVEEATYLLMEVVLEKFWGRLTPDFIMQLVGKTSVDDLNRHLDWLGRKGEGIGLVGGKTRKDLHAILRRVQGAA